MQKAVGQRTKRSRIYQTMVLGAGMLSLLAGGGAVIPWERAAVAQEQESEDSIEARTIGQLENKAGIDQQTFDTSVRVQDDLYRYVNGSWLDNTQIPSDKSNYGAFTALADVSQKRIREIIEEAAAGENEPGSEADKIGKFYNSFMNVDHINELGVEPLQEELQKIDTLTSRKGLLKHFGYLQTIGVGGPMGIFVSVDNKDSSRYLTSAIQSGTTLPDRDYYLVDDPKNQDAREELQLYVDKLFQLADIPAENPGKTVLDLETKLAEAQWSRVQLRDANARYNKYQVSELGQLTGELNWAAILEAVGVGGIEEINIMTPSYFEALEEIFAQTDVATWKTYLKFRLLDSYASALSQPFVDTHFRMHQQVLAGVQEQQERWKRGVDATAGAGAGDFGVLGEAVGKLYVAQHFKPEAKARMEELVDNLLQAYRQSINDLTWMTDETKVKAREKLSKFTTKIGYPNKWKDYSQLEVKQDDLVGNLMRSAKVEHQRMVDKLGQPVDREEWGMTPQTVNAYYNPTKNEIVFPAAILQPPFFNPAADDAVNYGGIGAVIGHEISHGFDDQGSKYDGDGNLNNWWTEDDAKAFKALTDRLVQQYAGYEPLPGKSVNGELTLGENIADLSGLSIAFKAYKLSLEGEPSPEIAGWSGEQRFFVGWSQVWRRKYQEAEMIKRLLIDPHSPSAYRANGPVINIDAFQEAFDLKPGDKLFKPEDERIQIW